jgi:hypothetical protein
MTETEWLVCEDPKLMLDFLKGKASDRKMRLLSCACCRRFWHLLSDERSRQAVDVAERLADGLVNKNAWLAALREAAHAYQAARAASPPGPNTADTPGAARRWATVLARRTLRTNLEVVTWLPYILSYISQSCAEQLRRECDLLRDIINPFRPVTLDPAWQTPTVTSLATAAYEERALPSGELEPARLAVLADALEEAGCREQSALDHLRGPGPHVRGCWPLDLILGKA